MNRILIIDGNNLLFQMFYGMPSKIYNKKGQTIHATIGFISFVLKQIKTFDINRAVVVFDGDGSDERKDLYEDYKANRTIDYNVLPSDEVPFNEEENIIKCLNFLGIKIIKSKNMEADDLIASLTNLFNKNHKVIISSFDSDFFQLINENVSILRYRGKNYQLFDNDIFFHKYGFSAQRYVFYKSLVGDNADNIKGVPGIGKVKGSLIVSYCSNLDEIINLEDKILANKFKKEIFLNKDIILRNIKLITLNYKEEIKYNIDDFVFDFNRTLLTNSEVLSACEVFN